jgi:membrane protease YdiL (CAAX protease family)
VRASAVSRDVMRRPFVVVGAFAAALVFVGALRAAGGGGSALAPFSGLATPLYVTVTVVAAVWLIRAGAPFTRVGFERPFRPAAHLALAATAVVVLQLSSALTEPIWQALFGGGRDLERFAGVADDPGALIRLLLFSWTFAAFGEEIAFRIVLLRGAAFALGGGRGVWLAALLLQAVVFGLVHSYQGPAGVAASTFSGLVYGAVLIMARGSIWPCALAHGGSNTIGILTLYAGG